VAVHEVAIEPLRSALGLSGVLYFSWVLVGAPVVVAAGLYFLPFLFRLPAGLRWRFILAGAIYVSGALGLEMIGGKLASAAGMDAPAYRVAVSAEESMEITGLAVFAATLIGHLARFAPRLTVRLSRR
jgi:hypothetical protein